MPKKMYFVEIVFSQKVKDLPDIIDGSLKANKGSVLSPEETSIHSSESKINSIKIMFTSKVSAKKFLKSVELYKEKNSEIIKINDNFSDQNLSVKDNLLSTDDFREKIKSITPSSYKDLKINIAFIDERDLIEAPSNKEHRELHKSSFVHLRCKVTNKIKSKRFILASSNIIYKPYNKSLEDDSVNKKFNVTLQEAKIAGLSDQDLSYKAMIDHGLVEDLENEKYQGKFCPEILYGFDNCIVAISDYNKNQFIGWFFINSNLDEIVGFSKTEL